MRKLVLSLLAIICLTAVVANAYPNILIEGPNNQSVILNMTDTTFNIGVNQTPLGKWKATVLFDKPTAVLTNVTVDGTLAPVGSIYEWTNNLYPRKNWSVTNTWNEDGKVLYMDADPRGHTNAPIMRAPICIMDSVIFNGIAITYRFKMLVTETVNGRPVTHFDSSSITFASAGVMCGDEDGDLDVDQVDVIGYFDATKFQYERSGQVSSTPYINFIDQQDGYAGQSPIITGYLGVRSNLAGFNDFKPLTDWLWIGKMFDKYNDQRNIVHQISRNLKISDNLDTKIIENPNDYRLISIEGTDGNGKYFNHTYFIQMDNTVVGVAYDQNLNKIVFTNSVILNGRDIILLNGRNLTIHKVSATAPHVMYMFPSSVISGISEKTDTPSYIVSPNPSSDMIRIQGGSSHEELKIFDLTGHLVDSFIHTGGETIYAKQLSAGAYFLTNSKGEIIETIIRK